VKRKPCVLEKKHREQLLRIEMGISHFRSMMIVSNGACMSEAKPSRRSAEAGTKRARVGDEEQANSTNLVVD
jgi:hypothetical protein